MHRSTPSLLLAPRTWNQKGRDYCRVRILSNTPARSELWEATVVFDPFVGLRLCEQRWLDPRVTTTEGAYFNYLCVELANQLI